MSALPLIELKPYLPLICLGAAGLAALLLIGFVPALKAVKSGLLKIVFPLVLIGACEHLKYSIIPEFTHLLNGIELVLAAYLCVHLIVNLYIGRYLIQRRKIGLSSIVRDTIKFLIIALFIILFLRSVLHWNLAAILTPSAILTAIIGLAMQDTIGNFIAGLLIQAEKPFDLNDWIEIEGQQGQVRELNWRYTKIETLDRYYMIIPNSKIATQKLVNYSKPTPLVNEFLSIGVSYNVPPLRVKRAIEAILKSNPNIVKGNSEGVFLEGYGDSSINYKIKYAIRDFAYHREIRDEVLSAIWYQFKKQGIEIPYPIRTVIMKNESVQEADSSQIDLLISLPFFNGVTRNSLSDLLRFGLSRPCEADQMVVEDGAAGDSMFFIISGEFNVVRDGHVVSVLQKGDFFGEMSLLTGAKRNARITAKTPGKLLEIDRHSFKILLESEPAIMRQVENVFNQRALANREAQQDKATCEEIKQNLWARFKNLFGLI